MLPDGLMKISDCGLPTKKERCILFPKVEKPAVRTEGRARDSDAFGKIRPRHFTSDSPGKQRKQNRIISPLAQIDPGILPQEAKNRIRARQQDWDDRKVSFAPLSVQRKI
jgi:hypothetical protein